MYFTKTNAKNNTAKKAKIVYLVATSQHRIIWVRRKALILAMRTNSVVPISRIAIWARAVSSLPK